MKRWWMIAGLCASLTVTTLASHAVTLKYSGATAPATLDPHGSNDFVTTGIIRQFYDSLIGLNDELALTPAIATEWAHKGGNVWQLKLRQGVKFHDGQVLTANDVVFSIMRQKKSPAYEVDFSSIKEAVALNGETLEVTTTRPDPLLARRLTRLFVMSKAWADANNAAAVPDRSAQVSEAFSARNVNGTGPMKLAGYQPNLRVDFARNDAYWGPARGSITAATYLPIASAPTRLAALLSGEVDVVTDLPVQDIDRVKATSGFGIQQTPQLLWMQLELDGTRDVANEVFDKTGAPLKANPFKDVRVRQAMALSIDANLIVSRVMRRSGRVVGIASIPGYGGYQKDLDTRWPVDLGKAKQLLAEAGYPNGFAVNLNCPLERYVNPEEICRAAASMLARVGIDVRVNAKVWPEFARLLVGGPTSSFHLIGVSAPAGGDTQDTFEQTMLTRGPGQGFFNWALWTNKDFDATVAALQVEFDASKRDVLYRKALTTAKDNVSAIYLHQPMVTWGAKTKFQMPLRADAILMLNRVTVK